MAWKRFLSAPSTARAQPAGHESETDDMVPWKAGATCMPTACSSASRCCTMLLHRMQHGTCSSRRPREQHHLRTWVWARMRAGRGGCCPCCCGGACGDCGCCCCMGGGCAAGRLSVLPLTLERARLGAAATAAAAGGLARAGPALPEPEPELAGCCCCGGGTAAAGPTA
jgi:hypothetical protein